LFFINPSNEVSLIEFNAMTPLPTESILNFSHRLDVAARKVYKNLNEENLNQVKFVKFLSVISPEIRLSLLQQDVKEYKLAVTKANQLQQILLTNQKLSVNHDELLVNKLSEQVNILRKELQDIKATKNDSSVASTSSEGLSTSRRYRADSFGSSHSAYRDKGAFVRNSNNDSANHHRSNRPYRPYLTQNQRFPTRFKRVVICQWCKAKGHMADRCRSLIRYNRNNQQLNLQGS